MIEKIKEDNYFKINIDNQKYKGYIYCESFNFGKTWGDLRISYYLIIGKLKPVKFLWFKFNDIEWEYKHMIGSQKLFEHEIKYELINHEKYFQIDDVKDWCEKAITKYHNKIESDRLEQIKIKNFVHKNEIFI